MSENQHSFGVHDFRPEGRQIEKMKAREEALEKRFKAIETRIKKIEKVIKDGNTRTNNVSNGTEGV